MNSQFQAYNVSLELARALREPLRKIATVDADLQRQLRRATHSIVLNLREGSRRVGRDRLHLFRIAAGSAAEVQASLDLADAFGYNVGDVKPAQELADRLLAMLWRLTERRTPTKK